MISFCRSGEMFHGSTDAMEAGGGEKPFAGTGGGEKLSAER